MSAQALTQLPSWVEPFLTELAAHGMEHTAAAAAKTTVRAVRALAERDAEFAHAVEDALERSADVVEAEVRRRAIDGIDKGIYFQGELCATEKQYSDSLLQTLIKAKRRREFGDKTEVTGPGGGALVINIRTFSPAGEVIEATPVADHDSADLGASTGRAREAPLEVTFREIGPPLDAAADLV